MDGYRYRYAGQTILSTAELPELTVDRQPNARPAVTVRFAAHYEEFEAWAARAVPLLTFVGAEFFALHRDLDKVICHVAAMTDLGRIRHLLLDHVLPRVFAARGRFVLHAGGFVHAGRAVLLMGESGQGKSTLTASFSRSGAALLGDDCFVIDADTDPITALATYRTLRLRPESFEAIWANGEAPRSVLVGSDPPKLRVDAPVGDALDGAPLPVEAIVSLGAPRGGGSHLIEPLNGRDAVLALVRNSFRLSCGKPDFERALDQAERVAARVPLFKLSYRRDFDALPLVRHALIDALPAPPASGLRP